MLKPPYATLKNFADATTAPTTTKDDDWARAALAGTRMLIAEESFDAIVQMLIDSGLVPRGCAAVMLDRLSEKLLMHASGRTDTHWAIRAPELLDQAGRLSAKASALRATPRLTRRCHPLKSRCEFSVKAISESSWEMSVSANTYQRK
ncbi:hypothetical protein ABIF78_010088 [Bradyrhizobium japonicum]